jgi:hypothetical protein
LSFESGALEGIAELRGGAQAYVLLCAGALAAGFSTNGPDHPDTLDTQKGIEILERS